MVRLTAAEATCSVLTYKDGVFSAATHDLLLSVTEFAIEIFRDPLSIDATFRTDSIRVVGAMKQGLLAGDVLKATDRAKIEGSIRADVLKTHRVNTAHFVSHRIARIGENFRVIGKCTICDRSNDIDLIVRRESDRYIAEVELHQPDFGIKPFQAMLGLLKIQAKVRVRVEVPVSRVESQVDLSAAPAR